MITQSDFADFTFNDVSLFAVNDPADNAIALANLLEGFSTKNIIGFDRVVWSHLSSGQMPSQLFSFPQQKYPENTKAYESFFIVLWEGTKDEQFFLQESYLSLLKSCSLKNTLHKNGELGESYEEEDFQGGLYGMFIEWHNTEKLNLSVIDGMKTFLVRAQQDNVQFSLGSNLVAAEDWLGEANSALAGGFFYLPSRGLLAELGERVTDKERIHLDQQIIGVRC